MSTDHQVDRKQESGRLQKISQGTVILKEGDRVSHFYKVISGNAEIYRQYGEADEYLLGICGEQEYFGDVAFLSGSALKYTVVAGSDMLLLTVSEEEFSEYISGNIINAIDIMKNLARSVESLSLHMDLIATDLKELNKEGKPVPIDLRLKISQYKNWRF